MKKEFVTGKKALAVVMALLPLMFFGQTEQKVQAAEYRISDSQVSDSQTSEYQVSEYKISGYQTSEKEVREVTLIPGKRLMKTIPLDTAVVTQIPRYIVEEDTMYVLEESSVVVEETGRSSSEGANVVTTSRKVEQLPDNDLERIEKAIMHEGISCDLLSVIYEVTKEDQDGIPAEYSALCEYGGLKKYSSSYPSAWQARVWYDACEVTGGVKTVSISEEYEYADKPTEEKARIVRRESQAKGEKEPLPEPEVRKIEIKGKENVPEESEGNGRIIDIPVPLAAAALGAGLGLPLIFWFFIMTAPLFALKEEEKYCYIGQIRLKKEESVYTAYLTKRLVSKAKLPVFMIKVPEKIRKRVKAGVLQIHCPEGKNITAICGKEVRFTLERE